MFEVFGCFWKYSHHRPLEIMNDLKASFRHCATWYFFTTTALIHMRYTPVFFLSNFLCTRGVRLSTGFLLLHLDNTVKQTVSLLLGRWYSKHLLFLERDQEIPVVWNFQTKPLLWNDSCWQFLFGVWMYVSLVKLFMLTTISYREYCFSMNTANLWFG